MQVLIGAARRQPSRSVAAALALTLVASSLAVTAASGGAAAAPPAPPPRRACADTVADAAAAQVTARLCGKRVGVSGATTETDLLFVNPDGTRTLEHRYRPVRVERDGAWRDADATLVRGADGSIAPAAATVGLRVSPGGTDELVTVRDGARSVTVKSPLGKLPPVRLDGNVATYPEVLPGVDLRIVAEVDGFAEHLVVKNAAAAAHPALRALSFPVAGDGVRVSTDPAGNLRLLGTDGKPAFASSAPRMWTADADTAPNGDVTMRAGVSGGRVRITPHRGVLTSPATKFPVIIDPGITEARLNWAWVDSGSPGSAYWNSTDDARVGSSNSGASKRRSFFQMSVAGLSGATIASATFVNREVWAWSCTAQPVELWLTGGISTATTWNNQPSWLHRQSTVTVAKGWSSTGQGGPSSCPAGDVSFDATAALRDAVASKWPNVTLGLRSPNETNNVYWKRFSNNPTLLVTYNVAPAAPANLTVTPSVGDYVASLRPTASARVTSPTGAPLAVQWEVWNAGSTATVAASYPTTPSVPSGSVATWQPEAALPDNAAYHLRVRSFDGVTYGPWSAWLDFTTDASAPGAGPAVSSADYPEAVWSKAAGEEGTFTFAANGAGDVSSYLYGLDQNPPASSVTAAALGGTASAPLTPTTAGPHIVFAQSVDRAGNRSPVTSYLFYAGSAAVTSPEFGDIVAATTSLQGAAPPGGTGATFQWRRADTDPWSTIPTADVTLAAGGGAVSWPIPAGAQGYPKLNWNVRGTLGGDTALTGPLQTRAVFTGGSGGNSPPVRFTFDPDRATAATNPAGPGTVNLVTGALTFTESDANAGSLSLGRAYNSRLAGVPDPMLGPGWVSSVSVADATAPYPSLQATGSLVQVGTQEGGTVGFTRRTSDADGATFTPQIGSENLTLTHRTADDAYTLSDTDGTAITYRHPAGAAAGSYAPTVVEAGGSAESTTTSWRTATVGGATVLQPTRVLAPVPDGVSCATMVRGCAAMTFTYGTATTATADTFGDYENRLAQVAYTAWDPDASPPAMRTVALSRYAYDAGGRLRQQWDPRLGHVDRYDYDNAGVLSAITPNAQPAWRFAWTTVPGDAGAGRLATVTRAVPGVGDATTTVAYGVPLTGAGAPADLSVAQTARWGQAEAPVTATAVYDASGSPASGWDHAVVSYLDANARQVNVRVPGGHLDATWYDMWGNTVRTLEAGARATALDAQPADPPATEAAKAATLSTLSVYSADGRLQTHEFGPMRPVLLSDGSTVNARQHRKMLYDQGAPPTGGPYRLVTSETVTAAWWDSSGVQHDADPLTTTTAYDWSLKLPTATTTDAGGLALTTRTGYDANGRVVAETTPAGGTSTTTPQTRMTVYYTGTANAAHPGCGGHPEWAGAICSMGPGGQAGTAELPTKVITYDLYGQARSTTESTSAGAQRTTTITHDDAGRELTTTVTAPAGNGTAVPATRKVYDPASGLLAETQSIDAAGTVLARVSRHYDELGRIDAYTDTDGNTTRTTYDLLSRVATTSDGRVTRTFGYDAGGRATSVTDSQAGTFTAGYDPDGNLTRQTWPNGIQVSTGIDAAGTGMSIAYTQPGCGRPDCTLFAQQAMVNAHGLAAGQSSTLSAQTFGYDGAKRLTTVTDTAGGQCVTRAYAFSSGTNRTGLTSYAPGSTGACQRTTAAATRTWTHDAADRITSGGYAYDNLHRITTVPAADTQPAAAGNQSIGYYVNDLARTLTQGGRTTTYTLDTVASRVRAWEADGVRRVNHYADDTDLPSWTDEGGGAASRTIRSVSGPAGVAAGDTITWQLSDLQGNLVASVAAAGTGLTRTGLVTEYGQARDSDGSDAPRYGWLGTEQRAGGQPGGAVLMGARVYLPGIGSFTSVDPVIGGSVNQYGYCSGDPINCADPGGKDQYCKKVWRIKICGVVVNISVWRSVYIARDRPSHFTNKPSAGSPKRWLPPWRTSRMFWEDTDAYRRFSIWYPVYNGFTAYVFIPYWGWS